MDLSYLKPMLCASADTPPTRDNMWVAEPKLDGWRTIIVREKDALKVYGGRNANDYSGMLPYLDADLIYLPVGTILDGELMGEDFSQVQSVMRSGAPHSPIAGDPALTFYAFDMLAMGGRDMRQMRYADRREIVESLDGQFQHLRVTEIVDCSQAGLDQALANGYEGLVCKQIESTYVHTRSPMWVKVKPQQTCEAKIMGFKPGKAGGKWDGKVGAFEVTLLANGAKTTVKCGTDERHIEATNHPERWLGEVIEIAHHGIDATSGVPRHPQFLRKRGDLPQSPAPATQAPPRTTNVPKAPVGKNATRGSGRNYGAMHDAKLVASIQSLRGQHGEAWQKVQAKADAKGMDPSAMARIDLHIAEGVARGRGGLGVV